VTDFRYALVESDQMDLGKQEAIIRRLELPVAALVYSGKKSIHAIVRVDASDYHEYKKRVDYLYSICNKNGLTVDMQNKNPSRLSRMPGVVRNGHKQFLIATNIGKSSWEDWSEWADGINDNLPEPESLADVWNDVPPLADELIEGMLRKGHKMLVAGPSKAGKSFLLIEMCIAIAEGSMWLGRQCAPGRVLYVNLELDRASCLHRFKDVYVALGQDPGHIDNIEIWNLRGKAVPMDKLAPKLIRRAEKKGFTAVVIDPIYKVITGDENSASEMARFCNQFDKVCTSLGCAVIYCHHHSKGLQGQKRSIDRASGSGVFARDPDAMLDMSELEIDDAFRETLASREYMNTASNLLDEADPGWRNYINELTPETVRQAVRHFSPESEAKLEAMRKDVAGRTAWRVEGILREFAAPDPINLYFQYPKHVLDLEGDLSKKKVEAEKPPWKRGSEKAKKNADDRKVKLDEAFNYTQKKGHTSIKDIAEYMEISQKTARRYVESDSRFYIENGLVFEEIDEEDE
jgi:RecA-family ATPase